MHDNDNLCELWHMRMEHLHRRALPIYISWEIVTDVPKFCFRHQGACKGCALGMYAYTSFLRRVVVLSALRCVWSYVSEVLKWLQLLRDLHR